MESKVSEQRIDIGGDRAIHAAIGLVDEQYPNLHMKLVCSRVLSSSLGVAGSGC